MVKVTLFYLDIEGERCEASYVTAHRLAAEEHARIAFRDGLRITKGNETFYCPPHRILGAYYREAQEIEGEKP